MKSRLLRLTFLLLGLLGTTVVYGQTCQLTTGWYMHTDRGESLGIYINFGVDVEISGGGFSGDVWLKSTFRNCTQVDPSRVRYEGVEYSSVTHPELFEGFNPQIEWLSYTYNCTFRPTGRVIKSSNEVCRQGDADLHTYATQEELASLRKSNPDFKASKSDFYLSDLRLYELTMQGTSEIIEKIKKMKKEDYYYQQALDHYNGKEFDEALKVIKNAEAFGYTSARMTDLKSKVEEALKNKKSTEAKEQLNELYKSAEGKLGSGDFPGAESDVAAAEKIMRENNITDSRFDALKTKISEQKNKAEEADKKGTSDSASTSENKPSDDNSGSSESASENDPNQESAAEQEARMERERLQRQNEYYEQRRQQDAANTAAATEIGMQMLLVHYYIGQQLYSGLSERPGNMISAPGSAIEFHTGYSFTSVPIHINITEESYDGNTYSYDNYSEQRNMGSINLNAGLSLWHLRSRYFGFGYHGMVTAGHGFYLHNFHLNGQAGIKAYAGSKGMQAYMEYLAGFRNTSYNDWLSSGKTQTGKAKTKYHQLKLGLRLTGEVEWNGPTKYALDFLPLFEAHSRFNTLRYGSNPVSWYWQHGMEVAARFDNRMSFILQYISEYPVLGTDLFGFKSQPQLFGSYVSLGVLRNIGFYANQGNGADHEATARYNAEKTSGGELVLGSPVFEYLTPGRKLVNSKVSLENFHIIGYQHNSALGQHLALSWGAMAGLRSIQYTVKDGAVMTNGDVPTYQYRLSGAGLSVPLGLRLHHGFGSVQKFWAFAGLEGRFSIMEGKKERSPEYQNESWRESQAPARGKTGGAYQLYGFGCNYTVADVGFSTGIYYRRSLSTFIPEDIARVQGVELRWAIEL